MKIEDTYEQPFPDDDLSDEDYIGIKELAAMKKKIEIIKTKDFENQKGPGIYLLFRFKGEKDLHNTTTHSQNIIAICNRDKVVDALADGDYLECTVIERPSQTDSTKTVITLA